MTRVDSRKALLVGINEYPKNPLRGCEQDAKKMEELLSQHEKGDPNFTCKTLLSSVINITKATLKRRIKELFSGEENYALFYYSGHGFLGQDDGYLVTVDATQDDEGIPMQWILEQANQSRIKEVLIILDCCHAGSITGGGTSTSTTTSINKGVTLIAAAADYQEAAEWMRQGVFTKILLNGLSGQAADVLGHVTPAGLYNLADTLLSNWQQRPIFKSHVSQMTPIRYCQPKVKKGILRELPDLFPNVGHVFPLTPEHEECFKDADPEKVAIFKKLGKMERAGIIQCLEEDAMYWEAMKSGGCKLTPFGESIWEMAKRRAI